MDAERYYKNPLLAYKSRHIIDSTISTHEQKHPPQKILQQRNEHLGQTEYKRHSRRKRGGKPESAAETN